MSKYLTFSAILALTGCATASPTYLANGAKGQSIDCSGEAMAWKACYEKAENVCPNGYTFVGSDGTPQPAPEDKTLGADLGNYKNRVLVITCK